MSEERGDRNVFLINSNQDAVRLKASYNDSWALVIGINDYGGRHPRLVNACNDAQAVATLLKERFGFTHVHTLFDAQAEHDAIMDWLRDELPQKVGKDDRLVIFFAGHGTTRETGDGYKRGYLIPQDAAVGKYSDYIDMFEVKDACNWVKAKHVLIILDCCFSGVAAVSSRSSPRESPRTLTDSYLQRITSTRARQVLTAGDSDEVVADSGTRPGHSAFTSVLLAGLEGRADLNDDGIITATDLASFVKPEVERATASPSRKGQLPYFNYLDGSELGDFVFVRPDTPIRVETATTIPVPPLSPRSPFWLATIGVMALAILVFAWLALRPHPPLLDPGDVRQTLLAEITATAMALAVEQAKTVEAAASMPAPTQTAIVKAQEQEIRTLEAAVAATITALAAIPAPVATATVTPTTVIPTAVSTHTPTPSLTPDLSATQAAAQETSRAWATATRRVELTITATHLLTYGSMQMAGATSLQGLTDRMIQRFKSATGYRPELKPEYTGTPGGFERFCTANSPIDVVLATGTPDRFRQSIEPCSAVGRNLVAFQVAARPDDDPLTLYTSADILRTKPQVAAFIRFYLENAAQEITSFAPTEYKPVDEATRTDALRRLEAIVGP